MSALVLGANGYIGFAVAQILRQNGYKVYGLVRKPEQSNKLASNEIYPVIGDANDPATYQDYAKRVEVIIDATTDIKAQGVAFATVKKLPQSPLGKKVFINTSGILVHGSSNEVFTSEDNVNVPAALQGRAALEAEVIGSKEVHGIVIRPGFTYGYAGGNAGTHTDKTWHLTDGKIVISGSLEKRWSWVHIYDLARAYLLAVQNFTAASGQVINVAVRDPPTYVEFRKKAAAIAGHKDAPVSQVPVPEGNLWAGLLEASVRISPRKAENLLGWFPAHENLLDDLAQVFLAYTALNQKH